MAERSPTRRIEPYLFDRIADRGRLSIEAQRRPVQTVSSRHLSEFVERDIVQLLRVSALEKHVDLSSCPRAADSVVNYGLGSLVLPDGRAPTPTSIARQVARAIERFEPRLSRVRVTTAGQDDTAMVLRIDAELWAQPTSQRFTMEIDVDVITGEARSRSEQRK